MTGERRMAILGGGPIGVECLLKALAEGWDAILFERGRVGENVHRWGHVRMFSPFGMDASSAGIETVGVDLNLEALPSGAEFVHRYLEPLAGSPALAGRILCRTEVFAVSRDALHKGDEIAAPSRGERPFRLLVRDREGERVETADIVVDATGTFDSHNWLGPGGIPSIGELESAAEIEYRLPDITRRDRNRFAGRHTLVVGAGHSAATAIGWLADLAAESPDTTVTWATRTQSERPVPAIADDRLPERERVTGAANEVAARAPGWLHREAGARILAVRRTGAGFHVRIADGASPRDIDVDRVLALVGYRPDLGLTRELQVQTCWATEGTYPLAAALLAQGGGADCLATGAGLGAETLKHPEAGFYTLGTKSYGRNSNFLISAGLEQIDHMFSLLAEG